MVKMHNTERLDVLHRVDHYCRFATVTTKYLYTDFQIVGRHVSRNTVKKTYRASDWWLSNGRNYLITSIKRFFHTGRKNLFLKMT